MFFFFFFFLQNVMTFAKLGSQIFLHNLYRASYKRRRPMKARTESEWIKNFDEVELGICLQFREPLLPLRDINIFSLKT